MTGTPLTPSSCCDGVYTATTVNGRQAWQTAAQERFLYFRMPGTLPAGQPLYVAITYADIGFGVATVQYDSQQDPYAWSEVHARSSRVNSGGFATLLAEVGRPSLLHRENGGADLRVSTDIPPLSVVSVTVQTVPFTDPAFQLALTTPWLTPVFGRGQPAANATTLLGAVMAGYQGWFRCPNDVDDNGWGHWVRSDSFVSQNFTTDMWPDMTAYPQSAYCRTDALALQSGRPGYVFSSTNLSVVEQHFSWMQQYNIDGVFLQRFVNAGQTPGLVPERVLANVRRAASDHGRVWAIEYDVSGLSDADVIQTIESDWKWLVSSAHILQDSSYAHENGKPVVVIWGYSLRAGLTPATGDPLVDFFKNDPAYGGNDVIGGITSGWQGTLSTWQEHYSHYNGLLVWQTHSWAQDQSTFGGMGLDYYADVVPGFSWSNLQRSNFGFADRTGGQSYWNQMYQTAAAHSKRMFVGMFDEYDEGTAIMPMSDDTPLTQPYGHFINNEGQTSTWWLQLTTDGKAMMNGLSAITPTMP